MYFHSKTSIAYPSNAAEFDKCLIIIIFGTKTSIDKNTESALPNKNHPNKTKHPIAKKQKNQNSCTARITQE